MNCFPQRFTCCYAVRLNTLSISYVLNSWCVINHRTNWVHTTNNFTDSNEPLLNRIRIANGIKKTPLKHLQHKNTYNSTNNKRASQIFISPHCSSTTKFLAVCLCILYNFACTIFILLRLKWISIATHALYYKISQKINQISNVIYCWKYRLNVWITMGERSDILCFVFLISLWLKSFGCCRFFCRMQTTWREFNVFGHSDEKCNFY